MKARLKKAKGPNTHSTWWCYIVAVLLILIYLLPIYIMLNLSFRTIQDVGSKLSLPAMWNFQNYIDVFKSGDLWLGFKNSIVLVVEMFMYVNFVVSIPVALDEAAAIDGAGVLRTFAQIIMPQLKAVTVTRIIMSATGCWNNYLMPMYLLQDKSKFTIILVIKSAFNRTNGVGNLPKACATCALGLLPVIVLYLFLQKYIIEGQIDSSVK